MKSIIHLCSFSSGLDELPQKKQANLRQVLSLLAERKRFSSFEASANKIIARTMDTLNQDGYIKAIGGNFPWVEIEITDKGREYLAS